MADTEQEAKSNEIDKSKGVYKDTYKGVKNFAGEEDRLNPEINTINIEAEEIETEKSSSALVVVKQKSRTNNKPKNSSNWNGENKKVGSLPYKEMLNYYIKGERVFKKGLKHITSPTYEDVAEKFNCSLGAVRNRAAKHNWQAKKKAYREKVTDDFSFYGQLAADINGEVLDTSRTLMRKLKDRLESKTFMPDPESIVIKRGKYYLITEANEQIPLLPETGNLHETQVLLNMARSLDLVNRICNNTVQVEIDNANLLETEKDKRKGNKEKESVSRMRQIEYLQKQLGEGKKLSKKLQMERAREAKQAKRQGRNTHET